MAKRRFTEGIVVDDSADAQIFRAAVRDVTPLAPAPTPAGLMKPKPRARKRAAGAVAGAVAAAVALDESMPLIEAVAQDTVTADGELCYRHAGVRIQVMRRLRRGLFPIDAEIDLHGLGQTAARGELQDFIVRSRAGGCRCVRIIHGKGLRSGARGPVLKAAVNLWLRRHPDVMAFVSARAIDGGAGAVYVLLRAGFT